MNVYRLRELFFSGVRALVLLLPTPLVSWLRSRRTRAFGNRYHTKRAKDYEKDRVSQPSWRSEFEYLETIAKGLGRDLEVLDIPCGTGRFFPIYEQLDWQIMGADISEDMLQIAGERLGTPSPETSRVVRADARKLPFTSDAFDVVVCFRFLQSIVSFVDARSVLAELSRVSRSWAILHLNVNPSDSQGQLPPESQQPMKGRLTMTEISELLAENNFVVENFLGPLPNPEKNEYVFLCRKVIL